jgi:hypothetical protein
MNGLTELASPFAVDDADLVDSALLAGAEVIQNQILHLARLEVVQIQHAIDRELNWLIHLNGKG